ncbi:unnamed protein product [Amaranthus hypochondriacus]
MGDLLAVGLRLCWYIPSDATPLGSLLCCCCYRLPMVTLDLLMIAKSGFTPALLDLSLQLLLVVDSALCAYCCSSWRLLQWTQSMSSGLWLLHNQSSKQMAAIDPCNTSPVEAWRSAGRWTVLCSAAEDS